MKIFLLSFILFSLYACSGSNKHEVELINGAGALEMQIPQHFSRSQKYLKKGNGTCCEDYLVHEYFDPQWHNVIHKDTVPYLFSIDNDKKWTLQALSIIQKACNSCSTDSLTVDEQWLDKKAKKYQAADRNYKLLIQKMDTIDEQAFAIIASKSKRFSKTVEQIHFEAFTLVNNELITLQGRKRALEMNRDTTDFIKEMYAVLKTIDFEK